MATGWMPFFERVEVAKIAQRQTCDNGMDGIRQGKSSGSQLAFRSQGQQLKRAISAFFKPLMTPFYSLIKESCFSFIVPSSAYSLACWTLSVERF
jgi:hypothetical protein